MFEKAFKLFNNISHNFSDAWELFQTGAKAYATFTADEKEEKGFMPKRQFNFDSRLQSFRGAPQTMQAPIGLRNPNIQTAHRYFAENQARDTNLQKLVASNYKAGITRKRVSTKQTMGVGSFGSADVGSARSKRVSRSTFRSRL
jgi:hypothetical protein